MKQGVRTLNPLNLFIGMYSEFFLSYLNRCLRGCLNCRITTDYEALPVSSEAFIYKVS